MAARPQAVAGQAAQQQLGAQAAQLAHVVSDRRQRRRYQLGVGVIVETGNGLVPGQHQARPLQDLHSPHGIEVGRREHGGGGQARGQQGLGRYYAPAFEVVGRREQQLGAGLQPVVQQGRTVGLVAFTYVELAHVPDKSDAAVAVPQQVLDRLPGTARVVRQHGGKAEAGLLVAYGHDGLAGVADGLEVVARDGTGDRYKAGDASPTDVGQLVQGDLLVVVDARGHSLNGHHPATCRRDRTGHGRDDHARVPPRYETGQDADRRGQNRRPPARQPALMPPPGVRHATCPINSRSSTAGPG